MPLSNELVLGWPLEEGVKLLMPSVKVESDPAWGGLTPATREALFNEFDDFDKRLHVVHAKLLEAKFGPVTEENGHFNGHFLATTPVGPRRFGSFRLELYADPDEAGHSPEDFSLGVALASRYRPVWIDWREERGTNGVFRFDNEQIDMVGLARDAIAAEIPEFDSVQMIVIPVWY